MNRYLIAGAATLLALGAVEVRPGFAQTAATTGNTTTTAPGATGLTPATPGAVPSATANAPATTLGTTAPAVDTSASTANQGPAKGSNSFTESQAQGRISDAGYTSVSDLKKDGDGIWRGKASKNGQQVDVWLDYTGHVGQL